MEGCICILYRRLSLRRSKYLYPYMLMGGCITKVGLFFLARKLLYHTRLGFMPKECTMDRNKALVCMTAETLLSALPTMHMPGRQQTWTAYECPGGGVGWGGGGGRDPNKERERERERERESSCCALGRQWPLLSFVIRRFY